MKPILLKSCEKVKAAQNLNKLKIPVTLVRPTVDNAKLFNEVLQYVRDKKYSQLKLTPSGGIATSGVVILPAYTYSYTMLGAELVIIDSYAYRIQFRPSPATDEKNQIMSGTKAYWKFLDLCQEYNINMSDYVTKNGKEVSDKIEKPLIKLGPYAMTDVIYENVHHIDWHSSYPAGLVRTHPEFKDLIEYLFESRKKVEINKAILNYSIGMFHSRNIGWKYSQLAADAIADNNRRVERLAAFVEKFGGMILLYNTDGFWYMSDKQYHDEHEGPNLGQWHHDHSNCKLRIKSAGAYEFIEKGKYNPVVRGMTTLDRLKDRSEWEWGDIYEAPLIQFRLDENGIHIIEEKGEEKNEIRN